jgi:predicted transcriptional regulator YheO
MSNNEFLDFLEKLASLIAETFGNNCEVVISDIDHPQSSILAIFNNHVTGRNIGDPLTPQALERVRNSADGYYINYQDSKGGKLIKTSTLSASIEGRNIAFCINYDCSNLEPLHRSLEDFLTMQHDTDVNANTPRGVPVIQEVVKKAIKLVHKPVRLMTKKDRLQVIFYLEEHGILQMQKSIQTVAHYLGISRYTVYNYLNELHAEKETS